MATIPRLEDPKAATAEAEAEQWYWAAHHRKLLERFPDQFVAVLASTGQVVASHPDVIELNRLLESRRLGPQDVWVRFITADIKRVLR